MGFYDNRVVKNTLKINPEKMNNKSRLQNFTLICLLFLLLLSTSLKAKESKILLLDQGLSLVEETKPVILKKGVNELTFSLISSGIIPESIYIELSECQFMEKKFLPPFLLNLKINSKKEGQRNLKLTYLTKGIDWNINYQMIIDSEKNLLNLAAWLTVENKNKNSWENVNLSFMEKKIFVQKEKPMFSSEEKNLSPTENFYNSNIITDVKADYILYSLKMPVTLRKKEKKTFFLFSFSELEAKKNYIFDGERYGDEVREVVCFKNPLKKTLNLFFPAGKVYIYKTSPKKEKLYIGTQQLPQIAPGQEVEIYLGPARGIIGQRVQTFYREVELSSVEKQIYKKNVAREYGYRLIFTNFRSSPVKIKVIEHFYGLWEILKSEPLEYEKEKDKIIYLLEILPGEQKIIEYKARII